MASGLRIPDTCPQSVAQRAFDETVRHGRVQTPRCCRSTRSINTLASPNERRSRSPQVGPDFAARLRAAQRGLRGRVGKQSALLDVVRAVNTTLEPEKLAELIVDRGAAWIPAPFWALVIIGLVGRFDGAALVGA